MYKPASSTIEYDKARLHYSRFGEGDRIILLFHGFGQSGTHFQHLAKALGHKYTVYIFDLFYHGNSFWNNGDEPLTKAKWAEIIGAFIKKNNIKKFSMAGFSLGAKFVLATLEAFPKRVNEIIFIAPDGIKTNFWYSLATYPPLLRKYFKSLIVKPKSFYWLLSFLNKLNLMDKGILKFATSQMNTVKKRRRVYYAWVVFRKLKFNMVEIAAIINDNDIKVIMYLGAYDRIITEKNMSGLLNKLNYCKLEILKAGHNSLVGAVAKRLSES